jgi:REP element-mobilizing transposase RayT
MTFELFDRKGELSIRVGILPHWFQPGVTYFVTFRTHDSVPAKLSTLWHRRRDEWLRAHRIDPRGWDWKRHLQSLPSEADREFHRIFTVEFMNYLDRGHGACLLRRPELAQIVANSLHHFDGKRYHLGDYVIMPNHVHLLCCLLGTTQIEEQCRSWKRFAATRINHAIGRSGRFWQEESFDHLVRSPEQFEYFRKYIKDNPRVARLSNGQYSHYRRAK